MGNARTFNDVSAVGRELGAVDRAQMRRLSALFDDVTYRVAVLRARVSSPTEALAAKEHARLREELSALEDDWRCLASAHVFATTHQRIG